MENSLIEAQYPISFREDDAKRLGLYIKNRDSVVLIGMKRVGISNFLRFFLNHKNIAKTYINDNKNHLFIPVDLNDLVEREVFPFWTLTLKRIVDAVNKSDLSQELKDDIEELFLHSIQSQDLFLLIDGVRLAMVTLVEEGVLPTLFLLRFDRIKDTVTPAFFDNLQGLRDATHQKLSYVFTSFRSLDKLSPHVFTRASLSAFCQDMYIRPLKKEDTLIVFNTYKNRYLLNLSLPVEHALFDIVDGYVQYLQLALIVLHERKDMVSDKNQLYEILTRDERLMLQSEEVWESLTPEEREVLSKVGKGTKRLTKEDKEQGRYLWETGLLNEEPNSGAITLLSPLFEEYLKQQDKKGILEAGLVDFSKKENLLFTFLKTHSDEICEREDLIEAVWPEVEALGVSDWAIDRLVARVRNKLKLQKSSFEIQTVKTRGYKLIPSKKE